MKNVSQGLFNLLKTKFGTTSIKTLTNKGDETTDMEEIKMFSFDFIAAEKDYGPVVILISEENQIEVYYGDNTSKTVDREAKKKWEGFIEHLSTFARSNRHGFSLNHTTDLRYDLANLDNITESYKNIFEGYYGTKKTSYNKQGNAKIIIRHNKTLGEEDKRFRHISSIFVENADGERFKLPFTKLTGARAMARHVTEGGNPYDLFGLHITEMVKDINTLGGFVRRSKMFEDDDDTKGLVETGRTHYASLRKGLKQIAGKRGYSKFKESWEPSSITEIDEDTDAIRKLFTERSINNKVEDAMPLLAKLQKMAEASDDKNETAVYHSDCITKEGQPATLENHNRRQARSKFDKLTPSAAQSHLKESGQVDLASYLSGIKSLTPIIGEEYYYCAVQQPVFDDQIQVAYFKTPKVLLDDDDKYHFQLKTSMWSLPKTSNSYLVFLFESLEKVESVFTMLGMKFDNIDRQILERTSYSDNKELSEFEEWSNLEISEETSDEDEWGSAMGHDQDDPEEMIGGPDDHGGWNSEAGNWNDEVDEMKEISEFEEWAENLVEVEYDPMDKDTDLDGLLNAFDKDKNHKSKYDRDAELYGGEPNETTCPDCEGDGHKPNGNWCERCEGYGSIFEDDLSENRDSEEDLLTSFMMKPQPVGIDGLNAISALDDIIPLHDLDERLSKFASIDPEYDARKVVLPWIHQNMPHMSEKFEAGNSYYREGLENELDADDDETLNASVNRSVDKYINKSKGISEMEKLFSDYIKEAEEKKDEIEEGRFDNDEDYGDWKRDQMKDAKADGEWEERKAAEEAALKKAGWRDDEKDVKEEISENTDLTDLLSRTNYLLNK